MSCGPAEWLRRPGVKLDRNAASTGRGRVRLQVGVGLQPG